MIAAVLGSWALFLGMALLMLGNGLQATLLGVRATFEGFAPTTTGLVMSGYFIGFLAGSSLAPRIVQRVGHVRVFAALASLASAAALVHAVFVDPFTWMAMRIVTGFLFSWHGMQKLFGFPVAPPPACSIRPPPAKFRHQGATGPAEPIWARGQSPMKTLQGETLRRACLPEGFYFGFAGQP